MQAKAIAKRLENVSFTTLYSRNLGRALQTAQYISDATGKNIITDMDLRERKMGIFQGYTRKEMAARHPKEWFRI
jgi:broad specificity phosphatase PhoE